jgi:K+-sensing histidine kinase KdpD
MWAEQLVDNLLDMSRLQAGALALAPQRISRLTGQSVTGNARIAA